MLFTPCRERKGTAYFEFQYCKKDACVRRFWQKESAFWAPDSLLVSVDDDARFFSGYGKYLNSPDGRSGFDPFGANYYSKGHAGDVLRGITAEKPADWEVLAAWLKKAAEEYNGFYFLGI